ncbi:S-adenosyl-L-methionine-dependent methyltransferase [Microthyrium microscopicum]|uniref:S-adenosyl-L-methionine-dependent methyltransferase n=1 Tax=Microthyrium microscopicum TaxID=703497 RepID=A0A6A6TYP9_9PEZI|nr:S-adenosyl-L-methionine-dependent methyltransferase [Microthyrium microscopicum]
MSVRNSFGDDAYFLPHDDRERDRLNFQDIILKALTNTTHHAPLKAPQRILDLGTGTGAWAEDIAKEFPDSEVIGTDICPLPSDIPDNLRFYAEDATDSNWGSKPFSFIHTRMLNGCFSDFKKIIQRSFDYLEPGGYMESMELYPKLFCEDGPVSQDNAFADWITRQDEAAMQLGKPIRTGNKLKAWYKDCGFTDIREEVYKIPINQWPRDARLNCLGKCWAQQLSIGLSPQSLRLFNQAYGWDHGTTEISLVNVKKSIQDRSVHGFQKIYVVWGQKPLTAPMKLLPLDDESDTDTISISGQ